MLLQPAKFAIPVTLGNLECGCSLWLKNNLSSVYINHPVFFDIPFIEELLSSYIVT